MPILIARFQDAEDFLERYLAPSKKVGFRHGGIFLPTRKVLEVGAKVVLDIRLSLLKDSMLIRGTVAWLQKGKRGLSQRAGLGIEFSKSEQAKRDHLLALVRGERQPGEAQRKHKRLPIRIPVQWRVSNQVESHKGALDDIGKGGVFIRTRKCPEMGTPLILDLTAPGRSGSHSIEGRVAWLNTTPGMEGVGVEFRCRDVGGTRRLRELLRRIEHSETSGTQAS